jgi:CheY-like chemotaxis protein
VIYDLGPKGRLVYDTLRAKILSGEYGPGSKLSAATELAEEFGVAPMTVRHALARLEAEGLLSREYGRGTFVRARTPASVLIVAARSSTRTTLRRAISRMGYHVQEAPAVDEALQALEGEQSIVLVLSEVRIPAPGDGVGFIRTVRRRWPDLPLIALTADTGDLDELYGKKEWPLLVVPEPIRARQVEEAVRLSLRPSEPRTEPQRNRVLVVDDDPEVRNALRLVLESLNCAVEEAADNQEARNALKRREFDHVFLDLRMPGGGVESARALARAHPSATFVLATAYPQDILAEDSSGLFTVLPKPFAIEAVEAALQLRRVPRSGSR